MVDVARYGSLLGHLENNPEISIFMYVKDKDTPIHVVGDAMVDGDTDLVQRLIHEGKLGLCASSEGGDFGLISPRNSVECLYLPPIYLVKDRGVPHI